MRMKHYPNPDQKATLKRTKDETGRYKWIFSYVAEQLKEEPNPVFSTEVKTEEKKKYTEKELYELTAAEQNQLIKQLDSSAQVPSSEKNRVKLLLKLQG